MNTRLENWQYLVEMGCGTDAWRLNGQVFNHPHQEDGSYIYTSTPLEFDQETRILKTASGRIYELGNCASNENEQLIHLLEDVKRGKTLIW